MGWLSSEEGTSGIGWRCLPWARQWGGGAVLGLLRNLEGSHPLFLCPWDRREVREQPLEVSVTTLTVDKPAKPAPVFTSPRSPGSGQCDPSQRSWESCW